VRAPLGAPSRATVKKVVRTTYRLEWEFDGVTFTLPLPEDGPPEAVPSRRLKVRTFFSRSAAYRAAAMRLIFAKRDKLATGREDGWKLIGCRRCDVTPPDYEDGSHFCKYHGGDGFDRLLERLARWLMWRDGRNAS
jgi:hypothetical protein